MVREYTYDSAMREASRCLMCDDAPCFAGCPAGVNPKLFIRKIRFEDFTGAVKLLRNANVLANSCAYICPCLSTCCSKCTSEKLDRPIDISGLQKFVMDWERSLNGSSVCHPCVSRDTENESGFFDKLNPFSKDVRKKVAVIGSGPAGLSCAAKLSVMGHRVEIFERENEFGGQLRLSIPSFRLPPEVLDYEIEFIKKLGVKFHRKTLVDDIVKLKENYDAVYVAAGLMSPRKLGIAGEEKEGVFSALDFLIRNKRGEKINLGSRALVIGGGDTAIDAARISARSGVKTLLLYRRTQKDMPAYRPDIEEAFNEGVEFWFRVVPVEVVGSSKVEGLKLKRISWKGEGRDVKEYDVEGEEFVVSADTIINATGQTKDIEFELMEEGTFAGGDYLSGGSTAVQAVGDGIEAAKQIDEYLSFSDLTSVNSDQVKERAVSGYFPESEADLSVKFCGVKFENPFILAAAPPTDELDMVRHAFDAGWAGAVLKTTSIEGTAVNLKYPMMSGLDYESQKLFAMGNIDLISEHHIDVVEERVRILKEEYPGKVVIASIMGSRKEEWQELVTRLSDAGADMIECSFSCPQGSLGAKPGQMLAQDANLSKTVAGWVKDAAKAHKRNIPVIIKITPHVTDICEVVQKIAESGADAVCASNTIQSLMGIDLDTFIPNPDVEGRSSYSGMSGPAIKPITLKVISEIARKTGVPIAGTGGPVTWKDAVEFILSGASIVQFCTAVMHYGFDIIDDLKSGTVHYMEKKDINKIQELIGRSLAYIASHEDLTYGNKVVSKINNEKCIRDDLCYIACRDGGHMAISLDEERKPVVDDEKCVGCGLCRLVCPVKGCIDIC